MPPLCTSVPSVVRFPVPISCGSILVGCSMSLNNDRKEEIKDGTVET